MIDENVLSELKEAVVKDAPVEQKQSLGRMIDERMPEGTLEDKAAWLFENEPVLRKEASSIGLEEGIRNLQKVLKEERAYFETQEFKRENIYEKQRLHQEHVNKALQVVLMKKKLDQQRFQEITSAWKKQAEQNLASRATKKIAFEETRREERLREEEQLEAKRRARQEVLARELARGEKPKPRIRTAYF